MIELQSIYMCPERMTDTCYQRFALCSEERMTDFSALDSLGQVASQATMDSYASLVERHRSWGRQDTILSLKDVFQAVADARYNALNPKTRLVCTGRTLIRNACSAKVEQT